MIFIPLLIFGNYAAGQKPAKEPVTPTPEVQKILDQGQLSDLGWRERLPIFLRALDLAKRKADRPGQAWAAMWVGRAYQLQRMNVEASRFFRQARALERPDDEPTLRAATLSNLGAAYIDLGHPSLALECYQKALPIARAAKNEAIESIVQNGIGLTYFRSDEPTKALDYFGRALSIAHGLGDQATEAAALQNVGSAAYRIGDFSRAVKSSQQSLTLLGP